MIQSDGPVNLARARRFSRLTLIFQTWDAFPHVTQDFSAPLEIANFATQGVIPVHQDP